MGNFNNEYVDFKKKLGVDKSYSKKEFLPISNNANNNYNLNNYQRDNNVNVKSNLQLPDSRKIYGEKVVNKKKK